MAKVGHAIPAISSLESGLNLDKAANTEAALLIRSLS